MNIGEEKLMQIIKKILLEILNNSNIYKSNIEVKKIKAYVFFSEKCSGSYIDFLEKIHKSNLFDIRIIAEDILKDDIYKEIINQYVCDDNIKYISKEMSEIPQDLSNAITIFPTIQRDLVVKTALCISDNFYNQWITSAIEQGGKIVFLKSGLKKFTNKEPKAYVKQIISYYRTILEYGIDIKSTTELIKSYKKNNSISKIGRISNKNNVLLDENETNKKIVTLENLDQYRENEVIVVDSDDIITDLAKEKARDLNIEIKKG